jgi:hypothetical protein
VSINALSTRWLQPAKLSMAWSLGQCPSWLSESQPLDPSVVGVEAADHEASALVCWYVSGRPNGRAGCKAVTTVWFDSSDR